MAPFILGPQGKPIGVIPCRYRKRAATASAPRSTSIWRDCCGTLAGTAAAAHEADDLVFTRTLEISLFRPSRNKIRVVPKYKSSVYTADDTQPAMRRSSPFFFTKTHAAPSNEVSWLKTEASFVQLMQQRQETKESGDSHVVERTLPTISFSLFLGGQRILLHKKS